MTETLTGRCLCGATRWTSPGPVLWSGLCHCESCRRAAGAPVVGFFGVPRVTLAFDGPSLRLHEVTPGVRRGFCADCGAALIYQADKWPEETHLMAVSLDDPARFAPQAHYHWAERLPWLHLADDLPRYAGSAEGAAPL